VFQIGSSLREARERRGLELAAVEQDTRISARWLRALEEERFDLLPERVYALGFLRTYADYLGLEGQQFVDELSPRLPLADEPEVPLPAPFAQRRRTPGPRILASVGVIAVVAVVVIALIGSRSSSSHTHSVSLPPTRTVTRAPTVTPPARHTATPQLARIVLKAALGRCWLDARLGSQNGRELYTGTLELGQSIRLSGGRTWIRLGAPSALQATLNGSSVLLPSTTPVNIVVTPAGVRVAR
jgi:cytoskeleton protein RodZ